MIRRIRELMAAPLARPPGRRSAFARFAPELCALAVYALLLGVALYQRRMHWNHPEVMLAGLDWDDVLFGGAWAYALASTVIVLVPLTVAAATWSSERGRGTLEGLLLTPQDHGAVAVGRFLHIAWPWVRFMLWMLPLYLSFAWNGILRDAWNDGSESLLVGTVGAAGSKPLFVTLLVDGSHRAESPVAFCFCLMLLRWLLDFLGVLAIAALGCHVAARARGIGGGLLVTWLIVPALFICVFNLHDWILLALGLLSQMAGVVRISGRQAGLIYLPLSLLALALELGAAWWALRGLARNFDAYALREKR